MKRAIVFCPARNLRIGLIHLKGLHLAMQVGVIVKHIRCGDEIGDSALTMICWAQHVMGVGFSILTDTRDIPHLKGVWLKNFRDELHTIGGAMELEHNWIRPPMR
eukprot:1469544-Ditylum_brightwellii.AAC.1